MYFAKSIALYISVKLICLSFVAVVKQKSDSMKKDDNSLKDVENNIEGNDSLYAAFPYSWVQHVWSIKTFLEGPGTCYWYF